MAKGKKYLAEVWNLSYNLSESLIKCDGNKWSVYSCVSMTVCAWPQLKWWCHCLILCRRPNIMQLMETHDLSHFFLHTVLETVLKVARRLKETVHTVRERAWVFRNDQWMKCWCWHARLQNNSWTNDVTQEKTCMNYRQQLRNNNPVALGKWLSLLARASSLFWTATCFH